VVEQHGDRTVTWAQGLLAGLIGVEIIVGGFLVADRLARPTPPIPNLSATDPITAADISDRVANCRTAEQWAELGEVYLATGFFPEAEACLRHATILKPTDFDLTLKHSFALERIGRIQEANTAYRSVADSGHPRTADCWYYIGRNHYRLEQDAPAADAFARAGNLAAARYELARRNVRSGEFAVAKVMANRLADEFPAAYEPLSLLYRIAVAENDQRAAAAAAAEFWSRPRPLPNPFDHEVDWIFGVANQVGRPGRFQEGMKDLHAGRFMSAERKLRMSLEAGWSPEIADKLAEVVFILGHPNEAAAILAEAVERGEPAFNLLWRLGQAYEEIGQPDLALQALERAARIATGPTAKDVWHDLALKYDQAGDKDRAKSWHARAYLAAGMEKWDVGRLEDAIPQFIQAINFSPELAHAWYYLGETHRAAGRPDEARAAYERCLNVDPYHGRAYRGIQLLGG
jgi:tetratricopeptide (TPR) repeat protein